LTQDRLAQLAGVNRNTVMAIERGSSARPATIAKLATALAVDPLDLIDPLPGYRPRPPRS
jgi:transcriptional regulator with XRE-family HTH domain